MTAPPPARRLRIGVDTGGTFTDVACYDESTGALTVTKTPSTPAAPATGVLAGLAKVLALAGAAGPAVAAVSHGTTIATNQLLQGDTGRLGFITTEGFEFLLEIARQSVPDGYGNSYFWVKPDRIVPAELVRTVAGRLDHTGAELRPFDEAGAVAAARFFRDRAAAAIGVCFLHAYANPEHERKMAAVLAREHPACAVSVSSGVLREYREYERSVTTLLDAAVKPRVTGYLAAVTRAVADLAGQLPAGARDGVPGKPPTRLAGGAAGRQSGGQPPRQAGGAKDGQPVPFYVMKSSGGVAAVSEVLSQPITTVLSGPAAGALGAAMIAGAAGAGPVLSLDGGGTSTDVAVIVGGEPGLTTSGSVGPYPCKLPMVDVVTVGAGGGSVAWLTPEGALKVGPRSAGADPGPLCYGRGGTEVTVTDAHLALGRIPAALLDGEVPLDAAAARAGIGRLAARLGRADAAVAVGVLEVAAWNQANAVRQVTVRRGLDVREFTLVTFGGSGSMLACRLIDILGAQGALVPADPGNVSAFGLLTVDVRLDFARTAVVRHDALDWRATEAEFAALEGQARAGLAGQGFGGTGRLARAADLRYFGQASELRVPVPDGRFGEAAAALVADRFHAAHRARYGYDFAADPRQQVEWVHLRVTGTGPIARPRLRELEPRDGGSAPAVTGSRAVCFDPAAGYATAAVYRRGSLGSGDVVTGPAVIEEYGATVPVHPGYAATVDRLGNLRVGRSRAGRGATDRATAAGSVAAARPVTPEPGVR